MKLLILPAGMQTGVITKMVWVQTSNHQLAFIYLNKLSNLEKMKIKFLTNSFKPTPYGNVNRLLKKTLG